MTKKEFSNAIEPWLLEAGLSKIGKWRISNLKNDESSVAIKVCTTVDLDIRKYELCVKCETMDNIEFIKNAVQEIGEKILSSWE